MQVEISDFAGGAKALQALVGGSADVVSGAYEHTINMQSKGQVITAFVLQGRAPQIVFGVSNKTMPNYKSIADLKGKKIGVTAPGSSTNMIANFVLAKGGLKPTDVSFIGVGTAAGALSALRLGQIDAMAVADTTLQLAPGEFVSVVEPIGCGKSTLLNIAAGLLQPSSGTVRVFGEPLTNINRRAGYMFQAKALMPWRSALDNVIADLQFRGISDAAARTGRGMVDAG